MQDRGVRLRVLDAAPAQGDGQLKALLGRFGDE